MRVPLDWLRSFVALPEDVDIPDLVHRLDMSGTKVEEVHGGEGDVEGVVVAEVLDISPHPNADNLTLVSIRAGAEEGRVVCGAKNLSVGDRVPYAQLGARLPGLTISERKIRGEVSRGMLCSAAELGVSQDAAGILILQPDSDLGADVVQLLGLDEATLELEITPNRPDCMSIVGVAREVAALYGLELQVPEPAPAGVSLSKQVSVEVEDASGCPRYLARYLEDISVGPSPAWMARRLLAAGFRPISNVVDVTNYVLVETGQPLHAFDAAKVNDLTIVVRRARPGETMETLDGVTRELHPKDLLIAGVDRPLALAGVMGGADSEVTQETRSVILESATFEPASVAFTSRRHGLRSEASARFERGSDPQSVPVAAARAAELLVADGAKVHEEAVDVYPHPEERHRVVLRPDRTDALLGLEISRSDQVAALRSIGLEASTTDADIEVTVPSFRRDLHIEADLIEEVARLVGFDRLPATRPHGAAGRLTEEQRFDRILRSSLAALGLSEAWTGSFSSPEEVARLHLTEGNLEGMVMLANPMLEQEPALRTSLFPGLLRSTATSLRSHRPHGVALFEIARIYRPAEELADEVETLCAVMTGERVTQGWARPMQRWDFYEAKGILQALAVALDLEELTYAAIDERPFHPTRAARIDHGGTPVGRMGELHPDVCESFDVPEGTVGLEVIMDELFRARQQRGRGIELPRFPSVLFDVAVVVDERVSAAEVQQVIRSAGGEHLVDLRLFDLYRGDQIPEGKKSLAFGLELQSPERTLTDDEATEVRERVVTELAEKLDGYLRT